MNQIAPSDKAVNAAELVLPLTEIAHLFNVPPVEPLSPSPPEVLGISGVDYLLSLLHLDKKRQQARKLSILLPPGKIADVPAEQTTRALHRLAELRIEQQRRELRDTYRYGWKAAGIAVVILAFCLAVSSLFTSDLTEGMRPLIRKTFEYGFEIVGWVILWHPIDILVFAPMAIRARIASLQTLAAVEVVTLPDQTLTGSSEKIKSYEHSSPGADLAARL